MKEYHIKENLCSGGFRIEDANGLHMFDVEGPCCMHVDEFVVVDSQGYKKARIEQNSFWSRSYCIYDDGWSTSTEKTRFRGFPKSTGCGASTPLPEWCAGTECTGMAPR